MDTIKLNDSGAAVRDMQQRLAVVGLLGEADIDGEYGDETAIAVRAFCRQAGQPVGTDVDDRVWAALVDASGQLGDRTLYLRMPYFYGHDVRELQRALGVLGFDPGPIDGIFGAFTEQALRKFQLNMALPSDGIAGAFTYSALRNLRHSWADKEIVPKTDYIGFSRAADVLERHALCLFGTCEFTRSVASRMSNLAAATNPASKMVSADTLLVAPDDSMMFVHIVLPDDGSAEGVPRVSYSGDDYSLVMRLEAALAAARKNVPPRVAIELPGQSWMDAGAGRSAQHYATALLDALCSALS